MPIRSLLLDISLLQIKLNAGFSLYLYFSAPFAREIELALKALILTKHHLGLAF